MEFDVTGVARQDGREGVSHMQIRNTLAMLVIPALLSLGCAGEGEEETIEVEDPAPPEMDEDGVPVDLKVQLADMAQMIADRDMDAIESQAMATVQGESMQNLHWTDWRPYERVWWGDGSNARAWVYVPYRSWRHINVVGWASACHYQPHFTVYYPRGGISGYQVGGGYGSYYLGTALLEAGWNNIDLQMGGDQYWPGVCDANIFVDYLWIP
jgi:hypothetical protein